MNPTPPATLTSLFEAIASQQPNDNAVLDLTQKDLAKSSISYKDLDRASSTFASHLKNNYGITPGTKIPLVTSRSIPMVIATLAILKLGCCYIPIDAEMWSPERIQKIVNRVGAKVIVSTVKGFEIPPAKDCENGPKIAFLGSWADKQGRLLEIGRAHV